MRTVQKVTTESRVVYTRADIERALVGYFQLPPDWEFEWQPASELDKVPEDEIVVAHHSYTEWKNV